MGKKNKIKKEEPVWNLSRRSEYIILAIFLTFVMSIFLYTMPPAMIGGDSGEFSAIACSGGIPHPPGYPLYAMISHSFNVLLPFGSEGWKPNFLSSLFAIFSIFLIYRIVRYKGGSIWGGLSAGGLFAFSAIIWRYSNTSEVFSLNNLFVCILLYLFFTYKKGDKKQAYMGAFVLGLGLTNHHTFAFIGLPIVLGIISKDIETYKDMKTWGLLVLLSILGLTPYLYLYFTSFNIPELSWGDQRTWSGFMKHFLREEFGTFKLNPRTSNAKGVLLIQLYTFFKTMFVDLAFVGLPICYLGLRKYWNDDKIRISLYAVVFYLVTFSLMTQMDIKSQLNLEVLQRFWQQALIPFYIWTGLGVSVFISKYKMHKNMSPVLMVTIIAIPLLLNFNKMNFSENNVFPTFGKTLLRPLEKNSMLLVHRDVAIFSSRYVQSCMDYRKDINILVREQMKTEWYQNIVTSNFEGISLPNDRLRVAKGPRNYNLKQFFDVNYDKHVIYITDFGRLLKDTSWKDDYILKQWGMVKRVYRKSTFNFNEYFIKAIKTLPPFDEVAKLQSYIDHPWEKFTWPLYWNAYYNLVEQISIRGQQHQNKKYLLLAIDIYEKMNEVFFDKPAGFWKVLGVTYQKMEPFDKKFEKKKVEAFRKYIESKPLNDKQAPLIIKLIKNYDSKHAI